MNSMNSWIKGFLILPLLTSIGLFSGSVFGKSKVDGFIALDNAEKKGLTQGPALNDLAYLRKVTVDLMGRIPSSAEIKQYREWAAEERRGRLVENLLEQDRFTDRWTTFLADMLRIRTGATGGGQLLAYVHKAVEEGKPFDRLARELISANGKTTSVPAVGYILGDNVDPMALTAATAQVFLGVRMQCAQCHDHPFDDWKQRQFYEMASFFGKTQRIENRFTRAIYTTEGDNNRVLWPPERSKPKTRAPVDARFPFLLEEFAEKPEHVKRLEAKREAEKANLSVDDGTLALDALLEGARATVQDATRKPAPAGFNPEAELKRQNAALDVKGDLYRSSALRHELGKLITHPRNRYFAQNFVNRLWAELMGRGLYEPIDDYSEYNTVSHPQTLGFLRKEFVAVGYDFREMIRLIVNSDSYSRGRLDINRSSKERLDSEHAFVAGSSRRLIGEALFDSIITAGHLTDKKWPAGANLKTIQRRERVYLTEDGEEKKPEPAAEELKKELESTPEMASMKKTAPKKDGYDLESSIALDFDALLARNGVQEELEAMRLRSDEELEAMRMAREMTPASGPRGKYKYVYVDQEIDDNPSYSSSFRMASPAAPDHFLRIFGQPGRSQLGDFRDFTASMRQALMMINGKLTHEASRVGILEPLHNLLEGEGKNLEKAIRKAYVEIYTREPSKDEIKEGVALLEESESCLDGMADLRWAMLNSHEFKFLP